MRIFFLLLLPALSGSISYAANFNVREVSLVGNVVGVHASCLRGDANKELIIASRIGEFPSYVAQLQIITGFQHAQSKIKQVAIPFLPKSKPIGFALVGDCGGDQAQSLVMFYRKQLVAYQWQAGKLVQSFQTALPPSTLFPDDSRIEQIPLIGDFNGDGKADLLWPMVTQDNSRSGALFVNDVLSKDAKRSILDLPSKSYVRTMPVSQPFSFHFSVRGTQWFPKIVPCDYNSDGKTDICLPWQDDLQVLLQKPDGSFSTDPEFSVQKYFGVFSEAQRFLPNAYAITHVGSTGSDTVSDFLINGFSGSLADGTTLNRLVQRNGNKEIVRDLPAPDGKGAGAIFVDVNRDGRHDVVTAAVESGLFALAGALISGAIDIRFYFFLAKPDGSMGEEPVLKRDIKFNVNTKSFSPKGFLPILDGDFNGDGLPDAVYGEDDNDIRVILQDEGRLFPRATALKQTVPSSELALVDDLNGDKKADVIFWYRDWNRRGTLNILTNEGTWPDPGEVQMPGRGFNSW